MKNTPPLRPGRPPRPAPAADPDTGTETMNPSDAGRAPPPPAEAAKPPLRVGRFEVRSLLGAGAFGRVFRGYDPELQRDVAIKIPRPEALTADYRERFLREARAAATIHHPNVCPVYEVGTDHDIPHLVMGFVPGPTLAEFVRGRGGLLSPKQAAGVVRKLALAVDAAHKKGVVHRDLKPGNVLVDTDRREVVVTDFGLARIGASAGRLTCDGTVMGTPAYMAPEQAGGKVDQVGPASDVYSLGVILYELLTGDVPFRGTMTEVIGQVLAGDPVPASVARPGTDPRLDAVCRAAMRKDPAARPSAAELAAALGEYLKAVSNPGAGPISGKLFSKIDAGGPADPIPPTLVPLLAPQLIAVPTGQSELESLGADEPAARVYTRPRRPAKPVVAGWWWAVAGAAIAAGAVGVGVAISRSGSQTPTPTPTTPTKPPAPVIVKPVAPVTPPAATPPTPPVRPEGLRPGDPGYGPPPAGPDGLRPGDPGFNPPPGPNGLRPGDPGFVPPPWWRPGMPLHPPPPGGGPPGGGPPGGGPPGGGPPGGDRPPPPDERP